MYVVSFENYDNIKFAKRGRWSEGASKFGMGPSSRQALTVGRLQVESRLNFFNPNSGGIWLQKN